MSADRNRVREIAVRAWTVLPPKMSKAADDRTEGSRSGRSPIRHALVVDTETTTDPSQALLFGAFRYVKLDNGTVTTVAEGLIYADDLPDTDPDGYRLLRDYVADHPPDTDLTYLGVEPEWLLQLVSRTEFMDRWVRRVGYRHNNRRDPALIVMFNAPFDWSRLAVGASEARDDLYGGFSFTLWQDADGNPAPWRPRLAIKSLDSKRSIKKFRRLERKANDFAGHLLDLRTLVFALTADSHSLDSACRAFGVPGKASTPELGVITVEAVDYCRQDVAATTGLLEAVLADYDTHPIDLQATVAYSPASIAKAYLQAMGIQRRLDRQPDFPPAVLGYAMSAFYGGRAEVHIRHMPLPVALVDVTSMYPSVDVLLDLWAHVTADQIVPVEDTDTVRAFLHAVTVGDCYEPSTWRDLAVLAQIDPDGDIVPIRADYAPDTWSIGVNPLTADHPMWFTLPDLVASKILSGSTPAVLRAIRLVPSQARQRGLVPVALRGEVAIDPYREDFFRQVVEERQRRKNISKSHVPACVCAACAVHPFLKVLANAGSYGIYAEMIRHELATGSTERVTVHGPTELPTTSLVRAPESPGRYNFAPIAACITGAARLLLALIEAAVTSAGGTWMFCDTDSLAIVATETGGLLACPGGDHQLSDGTPAVKALSYWEVDEIRDRINQLNPYDREVVGDLLKVELTGTCYAISAKRYVITNDPPP